MTRLLSALRWLTTPSRGKAAVLALVLFLAVSRAEIDAADLTSALASLPLLTALREARRREPGGDGDGDDLDGFTVPPDSLYASLRPLDVGAVSDRSPRTRARVRSAERAADRAADRAAFSECARLAAAPLP